MLTEIMAVVLLIALVLAIAIPNIVESRKRAQINICITNLRRTEEAKAVWVADGAVGTENSMATLVPTYIKRTPSCPGDGTYTVGNRNTAPTCTESANGHTLYGD
jgi:type II secretory pathway pseudopilin PulG